MCECCAGSKFVLNLLGTHPDAAANRQRFAGRPDQPGEERTGPKFSVEPSSPPSNEFWCACACRCGNIVSKQGDECSLCLEHDVHNGEVWLKAAHVEKSWPQQSGWEE